MPTINFKCFIHNQSELLFLFFRNGNELESKASPSFTLLIEEEEDAGVLVLLSRQ